MTKAACSRFTCARIVSIQQYLTVSTVNLDQPNKGTRVTLFALHRKRRPPHQPIRAELIRGPFLDSLLFWPSLFLPTRKYFFFLPKTMQLSLIGPGLTAAEDDDYGQLFVLDPDNVLSLQDSLTGLLSKFVHSGRIDVKDKQVSAVLADLRLPPMPCYPDTKIGTDALYNKLEEAQYKALAVYLSFSLIDGLLEPSFVASTIQLDAFKRTRQRKENLDCTSYWQRKINSNLKQSALDPTIVSFAQQEMLTLYFIYTLVKGPLNEDSIRRAKDEASALFYFENSVQSSFSSVDSEDSSSDMSDDEESQSTHSGSTSLSLSSVSSEASWIGIAPTKKRSASHRITGNLRQPTLENKKIGAIKSRVHTKERGGLEKKRTNAHDDISRSAICPMCGKDGRCDNGKDCRLEHSPHVNDQRNSHKGNSKQWTETDTENSPMSTTTEKLVTHTLPPSADQAQNFLRLGSLERDTKETEKDNKPLASAEHTKASKKPRHRGRGKPLLNCFKSESPSVAYCHTYMNTNKCDNKDCLYLHYPGEVKQFKRLKLCVDFLNNECPLSEDQCRYAHEDVRDVVVCKHWRKGYCNHGKSCRYLHYEPINEDTDRRVMEPIENLTPKESESDRFPTLPNKIKEPSAKEEAPTSNSYAVVARQDPNASPPPRPKRKAQCVDENGRAPTGGVIRKSEDENSEDSDNSNLTRPNHHRLHTIKCYWWWNENQVCKFRNCWFAHKDTNKVTECHWW
ncbi:hypothetical protein BJV82DRAFT_240937 [Fennellomyces sp. T-0311]|nr:hypothetical protein BJV82DRAFT_240937 [Fennellomyces sp. T-0311]